VCLLPPTLLMGATLPAIARWVEAGPAGVSWLGVFYGGNIAGAVFGCLLAGFYLLRVHDMAVATYVACALNATVAAIALGLAYAAGPARGGGAVAVDAVGAGDAAGGRSIYLTIALSGMSALGAEVVWTRLLSLLLGGTVYTFSLILAVFLLGLGIGSSLGAFLARRAASARGALGACQWLLTAAIAWTAAMISKSLPYWPVVPRLSPGPWYTLQLDVVRCLWAILPPACLWGASFPLALRAVAGRGGDPGRLVGGVYAANTVGAIAGALVFSLVLVPAIGTAGAERVLIGLAALAALAALVPPLWRAPARVRLGGAAGLAAAAGVAGGLAWGVTPLPWAVVAFGRETTSWLSQTAPGLVKEVPTGPGGPDYFCTYVGEGTNVSVAVSMTRQGVRSFHGAGKIQASTAAADMRLQRMLGHIPALVHPKPRSVLVVACGAGITAGTFLLHPDVRRVVICDIEPLVPTRVAPMFGTENAHIVDGIAGENPHSVGDTQVEVVYDDGRHFLRTTRETFDIITSDPIDPWVKGCAALNTLEYYKMCRDHLNPGGSVCLWMPLYESNLETTRSLIATFFQVFPDGILWSNDRGGHGYDAILFGQVGPASIDVDGWQARLARPDHRRVRQSLRDAGFWEPTTGTAGGTEGLELLATYTGQATMLKEWARGAQINTDRNLRLQYLAGLSLNSYMGERILSGILAHYRFPDRTFIGSPESLDALKRALDRAGRR
jgi:spermidine synthase